MTETNPQRKRPPCSSPTLEYDCTGCTDRHSEGTHQGCTKQHGHIGCNLSTTSWVVEDPQEKTCCHKCMSAVFKTGVPYKCLNPSCECHQLLRNPEQLTPQAEVTGWREEFRNVVAPDGLWDCIPDGEVYIGLPHNRTEDVELFIAKTVQRSKAKMALDASELVYELYMKTQDIGTLDKLGELRVKILLLGVLQDTSPSSEEGV